MSDPLPTTGPFLRVFVYGTLKCGYNNHASLCRGYASRSTGVVRGRVFDRPEGCPTLFIPMEDVLAPGGADLAADCRLPENALPPLDTNAALTHPPTPWRHVAGEIFTFHDGPDRLRRLDILEDFYPGEPSEYCRVVLPVRTSHGSVPCWAYISPHSARFQAEYSEST